jgi:hypothetical protein
MSNPTLVFHSNANQTVTLFVDAGDYRDRYTEEYPEEDHPVLRLVFEVPDGISISPHQSPDVYHAPRRGANTYGVILTQDSVRASFDWEITAPNRGHLDSEVVSIRLVSGDGTTFDTASILL